MTQAQRDREAQKAREARWAAIDAENRETTRRLCTETSAEAMARVSLSTVEG